VIEPFLRIENTPAEQGYNTSNGTPVDDKAGPWTHDLTLGELQNTKVTLNRISYFKLLLDVNEPGREEIADLTGSPPILHFQRRQPDHLRRLPWNFAQQLQKRGQCYPRCSHNHGSGSGDMYA